MEPNPRTERLHRGKTPFDNGGGRCAVFILSGAFAPLRYRDLAGRVFAVVPLPRPAAKRRPTRPGRPMPLRRPWRIGIKTPGVAPAGRRSPATSPAQAGTDLTPS
ncbi:hypothetical protein BV133_1093 [Blastochloris viridis]|uniref:Uncharacterized protein n=1 Tax=Blastochloris viridis TaxID=1079 RepID=A0A182CZL6_BLAVI|nr:hypothetical protein BV133_1093 [Blastochloris viridis]